MLDALKSFVQRRVRNPEAPVQQEAARRGPGGVQLAACALLLEIAHADGTLGPAEEDYILAALRRHFGLDHATAQELVRLAEEARRESVDVYQFTRVIIEGYDLGQKMVLAGVMWGVILADDRIAEHETQLMRKLGNLLDVEPAYLAQARRAAASRGSSGS